MKLANRKIEGVKIDLLQFLDQRRLESLEQAVEVYFPWLMPERDATVTMTLISDEWMAEELQASSETEPTAGAEGRGGTAEELTPGQAAELARLTQKYASAAVGLLIGSPEFQVK